MPELGVSPTILVDPPAGPVFQLEPPRAPDLLVVPVSGAPGATGSGTDEDPPVNLTVLLDNAMV